MDIYEIISVKIVDGNTLSKKWRSPMQKITTNKGVFIDNEPGKTFGNFPPGFNWSSKIGHIVRARIINSRKQDWISFVSGDEGLPQDNLVTTSSFAKKLGITTKSLNQKLIDCGYLDLKDDNYLLTPKGKEVGGQSRTSKKYGPYFMWPLTLKI